MFTVLKYIEKGREGDATLNPLVNTRRFETAINRLYQLMRTEGEGEFIIQQEEIPGVVFTILRLKINKINLPDERAQKLRKLTILKRNRLK